MKWRCGHQEKDYTEKYSGTNPTMLLCFCLCLKTSLYDSAANDRQNYQPFVHVFHEVLAERPESGAWPVLAVETETNGDSKSTNERGLSLVASLGFSCRYKRFLFCRGCSSQPRT
jgi:hypothetical protein